MCSHHFGINFFRTKFQTLNLSVKVYSKLSLSINMFESPIPSLPYICNLFDSTVHQNQNSFLFHHLQSSFGSENFQILVSIFVFPVSFVVGQYPGNVGELEMRNKLCWQNVTNFSISDENHCRRNFFGAYILKRRWP